MPEVLEKARAEFEVESKKTPYFSLLPPDNATGNFTKIVQRLAVRIVLDPAQENVGRLRPGLSVTATVHTNGAGR